MPPSWFWSCGSLDTLTNVREYSSPRDLSSKQELFALQSGSGSGDYPSLLDVSMEWVWLSLPDEYWRAEIDAFLSACSDRYMIVSILILYL